MTAIKELSRLEEVELRKIWPDEAQNFTPWLAEKESLDLLGKTLGLELELEAQEKNVGNFRADILCKNVDNSWVLIENQLEETKHDHLGQILTYAAGLDAHTVIWIAKEFKEEHRAALDQLNEITDDRFSYFGVEIKVWQIGNSNPAPQFEIVSKPNDWRPSISAPPDDWKTKFWFKLKEHFLESGRNYNIRKPGSKNAVDFGIGTPSEFSLRTVLSQQKERIGIRLSLNGENAKAYFHLLKEEQEDIETKFGEKLEWEELPRQKASAVSLYKGDTDPKNEEDWNIQHEWIASKLTKFDEVFRQQLQEIDPADWEPPENEDDE
ncbi:MAG: DUF4268 domain-containing protein [Candidatus Poribacteria bacterium]|nr:DUF4268 domain-containing protein [Candidatus Poribacteria bacterium]